MRQLTEEQVLQVAGGDLDRETSQFVVAMFAGAVSGGNGFVMGLQDG